MGLVALIGFCLVTLDTYGCVDMKGDTYTVDSYGDCWQKRPDEKEIDPFKMRCSAVPNDFLKKDK